MQICGCFGAMLPVWLNLDQSKSAYTTDLSPTLALYLTIAGVISMISIFVFVSFWNLYMSIPALTVFFMAWQFINVTFLAKVATHFKEYIDSNNGYGNCNNNDYEILNTESPRADDVNISNNHDKKIPNEITKSKFITMENDINEIESDSNNNNNNNTIMKVKPPIDNNGTMVYHDSNHSIAVMLILISSALFQVIIQLILFTWLNYTLYMISIILCILYASSTSIYLVYTLFNVLCQN